MAAPELPQPGGVSQFHRRTVADHKRRDWRSPRQAATRRKQKTPGKPPGVELGCSAVVTGRWSIAPALLFTQSDHCIRVGVRQLH